MHHEKYYTSLLGQPAATTLGARVKQLNAACGQDCVEVCGLDVVVELLGASSLGDQNDMGLVSPWPFNFHVELRNASSKPFLAMLPLVNPSANISWVQIHHNASKRPRSSPSLIAWIMIWRLASVGVLVLVAQIAE